MTTVYYSRTYGVRIHDPRVAQLLSQRGDRVTAITTEENQ